MRSQIIRGACVAAAVTWGAQAHAGGFVSGGFVQPGAPIDSFGNLPGFAPAPNLMLFEFEGTFMPGGEAEALTFQFRPSQLVDSAYIMLLDPAPMVWVGTDDTGPERTGVSWMLLDAGPDENKLIRFDFDPGAHFLPGESLHFSFWYRGRFGEGNRVSLDSEYTIVPTPGSVALAALSVVGLFAGRGPRRR